MSEKILELTMRDFSTKNIKEDEGSSSREIDATKEEKKTNEDGNNE